MKTKLASLILATGLLAPGAFAGISPATLTSTPILAPAPQPTPAAPTVTQVIQAEFAFNLNNHATDERTLTTPRQILPDADSLLAQATPARVVFSPPPSPSFTYDTHYPAFWYPSVSFRF